MNSRYLELLLQFTWNYTLPYKCFDLWIDSLDKH